MAENKEAVAVDIETRDVEKYFVDQMIGFTVIDDVGRVTFGALEFVANEKEPIARPVVALYATKPGWKRLRKQIDILIETLDAGGYTMNDPEDPRRG